MNNELRDRQMRRVVDHAKEAFASKGYYGTTISHLVNQADISRGTFYLYFDNKSHLFQSLLDTFLQELHDSIRPVALGTGAPPPLNQIQDNLTRVLDLVLREKHLSQILLTQVSTPDRSVERRLDEFYGRVAQMLGRSLDLGIAMKLVRPCDTRLTAYAIIGAVKETVLHLTSSHKPQPPVDVLVKELLQFGAAGILVDFKGQERRSIEEPRPVQ